MISLISLRWLLNSGLNWIHSDEVNQVLPSLFLRPSSGSVIKWKVPQKIRMRPVRASASIGGHCTGNWPIIANVHWRDSDYIFICPSCSSWWWWFPWIDLMCQQQDELVPVLVTLVRVLGASRHTTHRLQLAIHSLTFSSPNCRFLVRGRLSRIIKKRQIM